MEERKYPIYQFWVEFNDRNHNVSGSRMFDCKLTDTELQEQFLDWKKVNLECERHGMGGTYRIADLGLKAVDEGHRFVREETWCLDWFNHYTYNVHLTDEELLTSFDRYVQRWEPYTMDYTEDYDDYKERVPVDKRVCLMGAEDRWRWKGPCRCENCTKRGVIRIDH